MNYLIGVDEAGRGPWAGPVFAGIVVLNSDQEKILISEGVTDSKKLNRKRREELFQIILENSLYAKVKFYDVDVIDIAGVYKATQELIKQLVIDLTTNFQAEDYKIMIDGLFPKLQLLNHLGAIIDHECIIKGDDKVVAISAASILAKVRRDKFMIDLDSKFPEYKFGKHKGYGTKLHQELLKKFGPSPIHRKSFRPVKDLLG